MAESNSFFISLGSILNNKQYWFSEETQKEYNPIAVNIGLSQHLNSILYVNEANKWWQQLSPKMHYDLMFHSIQKMKRKFGKWAKKTKNEDVKMIAEYYHVNHKKAEDYLAILNDEQLEIIKESFI